MEIVRLRSHAAQFREIVAVTSEAEPSRHPKKLTFTGKTKSDTTYEVTYEFKGDTIAGHRVKRLTKHPPGHRGCNCGVTPA